MAVTFATPNTILGVLQPKGRTAQVISMLAVAFVGSILLTISAKISVPLLPVPVSLATFAVAALSAAFGWRIGVVTVALYLAQGLAGLPVFSGPGAGPAYLMGPTGGFLIGYLPMAYIIGRFADAGASRNAVALFGVNLLGDAVLFLFGFAWLYAMAGSAAWVDQANVLGSAFDAAVRPFIVWDILKMALASLTVLCGWTVLKRLRP